MKVWKLQDARARFKELVKPKPSFIEFIRRSLLAKTKINLEPRKYFSNKRD